MPELKNLHEFHFFRHFFAISLRPLRQVSVQIDRSGLFFTVFCPMAGAMGLQIRQKLFSLGPIFAIDAPNTTASEAWQGQRRAQSRAANSSIRLFIRQP
jgi:hypothetical protein